MAVVDGQELGPPLGRVVPYAWGFSPGGNRFYVGGALESWYSATAYIVDGVAGPAFGAISPIAFSSDEAHYAYAGANGTPTATFRIKTQGTIVVDGRPRETYEGSGTHKWWLAMFGGMTSGILTLNAEFHAKDPLPSWLPMPADVAAKKIVSAVYRRRREAIITFHGKVLVWLSRFAPPHGGLRAASCSGSRLPIPSR